MDSNVRDEIFKFVLDMAFNDATMRSAFRNPYKESGRDATKEEQKAFRELKNDLKESFAITVETYLKSIIDGNTTEDTVYETIREVLAKGKSACDKHRKEGSEIDFDFTFGHAQKVVNMAAKYLFISCYAEPKLREHFEYCHCPMDKYMIKGVLKNYAKESIKEIKLKKDTAWSGITLKNKDCSNDIRWFIEKAIPDEYLCFKNLVDELRGNDYPLEFDYRNWPDFVDEFGD